ncbi:MAG: hypothetical protein RR177_05930 [Oscillospiraceae bacterium]
MNKIYVPTGLWRDIDEKNACESFLEAFEENLKGKDIDVLKGKCINLKEIAEECRSLNADIYYSVHTNISKLYKSSFSSLEIFSLVPAAKTFKIASRIRKGREMTVDFPVFLSQNKRNREIVSHKTPAIVDYLFFGDNEENKLMFKENTAEISAAAANAFIKVLSYY